MIGPLLRQVCGQLCDSAETERKNGKSMGTSADGHDGVEVLVDRTTNRTNWKGVIKRGSINETEGQFNKNNWQ